jgi:hypothetical protein
METIIGNDGFEFDNNSTYPPNKELTLEQRMHIWFVEHRPNRDVCDSVDEMNDIDKAKYLDECGIPKILIKTN